jgi:hypothetical protein
MGAEHKNYVVFYDIVVISFKKMFVFAELF